MRREVEIREFAHTGDYAACVALQRRTWGADFSDVVPLSVLKISQKVGGIAAGAFSPQGELLAFVYGLTGLRGGIPIHWSHMMAVAPEARDLGLGTRLKLFQRQLLLAAGVERVEWTYDPLEARNAHLNLNRLGAEVDEYVEEMYAGESGSDLWQGIGTDRLIVVWRIASPQVHAAIAAIDALASGRGGEAARFLDAPVVNAGRRFVEVPAGAGAPRVRIEIPESVQALKGERTAEAAEWRASSRAAFQACLGRGYRVEAFYRDAADSRCFYCLELGGGAG
jgi:predicted GNAT superfamily acetyltransferase